MQLAAPKHIGLAGKTVLIRNCVLVGGKKRGTWNCVLYCFLIIFQWNDKGKGCTYRNTVFGIFDFKINKCNVLYILVYYKAVLRKVRLYLILIFLDPLLKETLICLGSLNIF